MSDIHKINGKEMDLDDEESRIEALMAVGISRTTAKAMVNGALKYPWARDQHRRKRVEDTRRTR
jgi:uncharacterized protein YoaH (UPF0181 family)